MNEKSQTQAAKHLVVAAILVMLLAPIAFGVVPVEAAAAARVYISAASPDKSGYAVDEAVNINVKYKWEGLSANVTVNVQLWNATDIMEDLANYTVPYNVTGTLTPSGTRNVQYTPTVELTDEVGTKTYSLKILSGGIVTDTATITIVVAKSQVTMSITWQDQNNDRIVDVNELVTFTAYVNWAFVETTEAHSLYVNYGDGDTLLSSVTVTAGSGSQTVTDSHGFNAAGAKTATFTLKDATGTTVKTSSAAINVGSGTPAPVTAQSSVVELVTANWQILAIGAAVVVVGYLYLGKGKKGKK